MKAIQAATECVLVIIWGSAAVFGAAVIGGAHAQERFSATLLWVVANSTLFLMLGAVLFFVASGARRIATPLPIIRILGLLGVPVAAYFTTRPSLFFFLNQPGYFFLGPLMFLAIFIALSAGYGVWLLPRLVKADHPARLHVHWVILLLSIPPIPMLIYSGVSGDPRQITGATTEKPTFEIIYARWTPGSAPLTVEPFDMHLQPPRGGLVPEPDRPAVVWNLSEQEIDRLRGARATGQVKVIGGATSSNHVGRLVLIMSQPLDAPFAFLGPGSSDVIYLQTDSGWRKLPPDADESTTRVRLYAAGQKPFVTGIEIDRGDGHPYRDETRFRWLIDEPGERHH